MRGKVECRPEAFGLIPGDGALEAGRASDAAYANVDAMGDDAFLSFVVEGYDGMISPNLCSICPASQYGLIYEQADGYV